MADSLPTPKYATLSANSDLGQVAADLGRSEQFFLPNIAVNFGAAGRMQENRFGVPQSGCEPWRGSACSNKCVPSNCARPCASRGKCAGVQSSSTPIPA